MNIEQKLKLSEDPNSIYFFREGIFAQVYNLSLYLAITELGLSVKIGSQRYQKLGNRLVLKGGLPTAMLESRYPNLIKHEWGYQLTGSWDISGFGIWYQHHLGLQRQVEQQKTLSKTIERDVAKSAATRHLMLTEQEYQALKQILAKLE